MKKSLGFLCFVVLAACGGRVSTVDDANGTPSPGSTATTRPPSTDVPPPVGGREPGPGIPTKPPPPPSDKVAYTAHAWAGGLDHLEIAKADFTNDRCTRVYLTNPGSTKEFASIDAPSTWAVSNGSRSPGAKGCEAGTPTKPLAQATDGKGEISWKEDPGVYLPCSLSIHAVFLFEGTSATESLDAENVTVKGCQ